MKFGSIQLKFLMILKIFLDIQKYTYLDRFFCKIDFVKWILRDFLVENINTSL
jgi:hypothetical protein